MWRLIWKNIARRRAQSALTVTIAMLTVMAFVMVLGVSLTVSRGLALSRKRLGADAVLVPPYATATGGDLLFTAAPERVYMPIDVVEQARRIEGVATMTPQFYCQTLARSCCEPGDEIRIIGYDPDTDFVLRPYLDEAGRDGIGSGQLVVGSNFEDDELVGHSCLVLGRKFQVAGMLEPTGTGMDGTIFMDWRTAQDMCLESEVLRQDWQGRDPHDFISVVMLKLADGVDGQDVAEQVERLGLDAKCLLTSDTISSLQDQLEAVMYVMFALWAAPLLIAALSLTGRFSALAKGRKKEIGLMRAIGLGKGKVFGLVLGEACAMALMGGLLGSGAALLCMGPAIELLKDAFKLSPSVWSARSALSCGGAGVALTGLLGLVAAIVPAWHAASMDPQAAITQGEVG